MQLSKKSDVKLLGRSFNEDWPMTQAVRQQAIDALVYSLGDPELVIDASKALMKADEQNLRRQQFELKERLENEKIRLRLLEFLGSLEPEEIGKLSSASGVVVGKSRRTNAQPRANGKKASKRTRPRNSASVRSQSSA